MHIYINSCHAALEYDHARMFTSLGHKVSGIFDVGSNQRPKLQGVTDISRPDDVRERSQNLVMTSEDLRGVDLIVVHQTMDLPARAFAYARFGVPVVCTIFGQGNPDSHAALAQVMEKTPNVHAVVYSTKAACRYGTTLGVSPDRWDLIYFSKPRSEFDPESWIGCDPVCLVPCNDIHNRGEGCGWAIAVALLARGVPLRLVGKRTEEVGGLGELTFDELREQYKRCQCYLSLGTIPAPYTLTFVEAASSGTPMVAYDNGHGVAGEGFDVPMCETVDQLEVQISFLLQDKIARLAAHSRSVRLADEVFDPELATAKWGRVLNRLHAKWARKGEATQC